MEADFSIELGREDAVLEVPWTSAHGTPAYFDLKRRPELLREVEEAQRTVELAGFLAEVNSPASLLETAKCDVWSTNELQLEDAIFDARWKFGSYVDLLLPAAGARFSLELHQSFAHRLREDLRRFPEFPAAAEFVVRRCYYHAQGETRDGFCLTFYLFGYGDDEGEARRQWARALKLVEAILVKTVESEGFV